MRESFELPTGTAKDLASMLDRATMRFGLTLPPEIADSYRDHMGTVSKLCGMEKRGVPAGFGPNVAEDLSTLIDLGAKAAMEPEAGQTEYYGRPDAIMLKVFRDYFLYTVSQLPVGASVYWRPEVKGHLRLVVTDGKRPKGYLKLI